MSRSRRDADMLRMKTTLQELVTAVENLVSWAERQGVTKQDLHEALGQGQAEQQEFDDDNDDNKDVLTPEQIADYCMEVLSLMPVWAVAAVYQAAREEADLRGLIDSEGRLY
jgi:hypothetical protein